jgi:hypothetical protein
VSHRLSPVSLIDHPNHRAVDIHDVDAKRAQTLICREFEMLTLQSENAAVPQGLSLFSAMVDRIRIGLDPASDRAISWRVTPAE